MTSNENFAQMTNIQLKNYISEEAGLRRNVLDDSYTNVQRPALLHMAKIARAGGGVLNISLKNYKNAYQNANEYTYMTKQNLINLVLKKGNARLKEAIRKNVRNLLNENIPIERALKFISRKSLLEHARNANTVGVGGYSNIGMNRVINRNLKSCPVGRLQVGGTCWFQAILNGWILSPLGRAVMRVKLEQFKMSNEMKKFTNIQACPMRGKMPVYFWSYVEYMLDTVEKGVTNKKFDAVVQRGLQFKHANLIRNVGLRRNEHMVSGGSMSDTEKFMDYLFPGVWSSDLKKAKSVFYKKINNPKSPIERKIGKFELSHAYIAADGNTSMGHAITGYYCPAQNAFLIYDSNFMKPIEVDWTKDFDGVKQYFASKYWPGKETHLFIRALYVDKTATLGTIGKRVSPGFFRSLKLTKAAKNPGNPANLPVAPKTTLRNNLIKRYERIPNGLTKKFNLVRIRRMTNTEVKKFIAGLSNKKRTVLGYPSLTINNSRLKQNLINKIQASALFPAKNLTIRLIRGFKPGQTQKFINSLNQNQKRMLNL